MLKFADFVPGVFQGIAGAGIVVQEIDRRAVYAVLIKVKVVAPETGCVEECGGIVRVAHALQEIAEFRFRKEEDTRPAHATFHVHDGGVFQLGFHECHGVFDSAAEIPGNAVPVIGKVVVLERDKHARIHGEGYHKGFRVQIIEYNVKPTRNHHEHRDKEQVHAVDIHVDEYPDGKTGGKPYEHEKVKRRNAGPEPLPSALDTPQEPHKEERDGYGVEDSEFFRKVPRQAIALQREDAEEVADILRNFLERDFAITEIQQLGDAQERERNGIHTALVHQHEQQKRNSKHQKNGKGNPSVTAVAQLANPEQVGHLQKNHERDHGPDCRVGVKREPVEQRREHQEFRAFDTLRKKVNPEQHEGGSEIRFEPPARQHDVPRSDGKHEQHSKRLAGTHVHFHKFIYSHQREDAGQQHGQADNPNLEAEKRHKGHHQVRLERVHAGTPGGEVHRHAEPEGIPRRRQKRVSVVTGKSLVLVDVGGNTRKHETARENAHGKEQPEQIEFQFHGHSLLFQLDNR